MSSGAVRKRFATAIEATSETSKVSYKELLECCAEYRQQILKRNALIHAHPGKGIHEAIIAALQCNPDKPLPEMKWSVKDLATIITKFEGCAARAGKILETLRM